MISIVLTHIAVAQNHPVLDAPVRSSAFDLTKYENKYRLTIDDSTLRLKHTITIGTPVDSLQLVAGSYKLDAVSLIADTSIVEGSIGSDPTYHIEGVMDSVSVDSIVATWSRPQQSMQVLRVNGRNYFVERNYPQLTSVLFPFVGNAANQSFELRTSSPDSISSPGHMTTSSDSTGSTATFSVPSSAASFGQYLVIGELDRIEDRVLLPGRKAVNIEYVHTGETQRDVLKRHGSAPEAIRFFSESFGWEPTSNSIRFTAIPGLDTDRYAQLTGLFGSADQLSSSETENVLSTASSIAFSYLADRATLSAQDTWLFTGLPLYLGAMFVEADRGTASFDSIMFDLHDRFLDEQQTYSRPLFMDRWHEPVNLLDEHAFARGAWTVHVLRHMLGDETFGQVIGKLTDGDNELSSDNLTQILEDYLDRDQQVLQRDLFYSQTLPSFGIEWAYSSSNRSVVVSITRTGESSANIPVEIAIETLTGTDFHTIQLEGSAVRQELPVTGRPRFITVDPRANLLASYTVEQPVTAWVASLRNADRVPSRIAAARALRKFADDPALLIGLKSALRTESSLMVIEEILDTVGRIRPSAASEQTLISYVSNDSARIREAAIRALSRYSDSPGTQNSIRELLGTEQDEFVLAEAVRFISATQMSDRSRILQSALITSTPNSAVRVAGVRGLSSLDDPSVLENETARYVRPEHSEAVRIAAIQTRAASLNGRERELFIANFLMDEDPEIRATAIELLQADSDDFLTKVQGILEREQDPRVRQRIRWLLYRNAE